MNRFVVKHRTRYQYSVPVSLGYNEARLLPRATPGQACIRSNLTIHPEPSLRHERTDAFGNRVVFFSLESSHREFQVDAESEVEVWAPLPDTAVTDDEPWTAMVAHVGSSPARDQLTLATYTIPSPYVPLDRETADNVSLAEYCRELTRDLFDPELSVAEVANQLNRWVYETFTYDPKATTIHTPLEIILRDRHGVCQDYTHAALAILRAWGIPARYVSGYLETSPPPGQPRLEGADASHAWFSVYTHQRGWVDFDPTNGLRPTDFHITLGWGRDFFDVTPLKGVILGGGKHDVDVGVQVHRQVPALIEN